MIVVIVSGVLGYGVSLIGFFIIYISLVSDFVGFKVYYCLSFVN